MSIPCRTMVNLGRTLEEKKLEHLPAGLQVCLPITEKTASIPVTSLTLSVRSMNCLMRAGAFTLLDVAKRIEDGTLEQIRSLGKTSAAEIRLEILKAVYFNLNRDAKDVFWADVNRRMTDAVLD